MSNALLSVITPSLWSSVEYSSHRAEFFFSSNIVDTFDNMDQMFAD